MNAEQMLVRFIIIGPLLFIPNVINLFLLAGDGPAVSIPFLFVYSLSLLGYLTWSCSRYISAENARANRDRHQ